MKGVPYLNPDPYCQFIGPQNWGEALIDEELMTCLLDNGSQLNFITPAYAHKQRMDIMSLDSLAQEVRGKLPPIFWAVYRQYHGGSRRICYDEC